MERGLINSKANLPPRADARTGGTVTAILTDLTGRRKEVRLTPDGYNQYTLDLTSLPQATYLLTLTTADGRQHTLK